MLDLDISLFWVFNNLAGESEWADLFYVFIAKYLIYAVIFAVICSWLLWRTSLKNKIKVALVFVTVSAISYAVVFFVFHPLWPRVRPFEALLNVNQLVSESGFSFPSKHALFSFLLATFLFGFHRRFSFWLFICAILVSLGRVFVGVHYPFDVAIGAICGIIMGTVGYVVARRLVSFD